MLFTTRIDVQSSKPDSPVVVSYVPKAPPRVRPVAETPVSLGNNNSTNQFSSRREHQLPHCLRFPWAISSSCSFLFVFVVLLLCGFPAWPRVARYTRNNAGKRPGGRCAVLSGRKHVKTRGVSYHVPGAYYGRNKKILELTRFRPGGRYKKTELHRKRTHLSLSHTQRLLAMSQRRTDKAPATDQSTDHHSNAWQNAKCLFSCPRLVLSGVWIVIVVVFPRCD